MNQAALAPLFAVPFGAQAQTNTITQIPQTSTAIGRASMALGFPASCMTPLAAGGNPPYGQDLNGILNMLSVAAQAAELGMMRPFSASYAAAVGGYPAGATVAHPSITGRYLLCTQDGNSNDPSVSMAGWLDPMASMVTSPAASDTGYSVDAVGINRQTGQAWVHNANTGAFLFLQSAGNYQPAGNYALASDLANETQRAEAAEAGLLPLAGGTMSGTITGSAGGIVPQVLGQSGRVVEQAFVASGGGLGANAETNILFPAPFLAGTTPIVSVTINREPTTYLSRGVCFGNTNSSNSPNINNTGFWFQPYYMSGGTINTTGSPWTVHVRAIGVV